LVKLPFLGAIGLALGACSVSALPDHLARPADPNAPAFPPSHMAA